MISNSDSSLMFPPPLAMEVLHFLCACPYVSSLRCCTLDSDQPHFAAHMRTAVPSPAAPVPHQAIGVHVPSIPTFLVPDQWARPACLPPTPPPSPPPAISDMAQLRDDGQGAAGDSVMAEPREVARNVVGEGDAMEVEGENGKSGKQSEASKPAAAGTETQMEMETKESPEFERVAEPEPDPCITSTTVAEPIQAGPRKDDEKKASNNQVRQATASEDKEGAMPKDKDEETTAMEQEEEDESEEAVGAARAKKGEEETALVQKKAAATAEPEAATAVKTAAKAKAAAEAARKAEAANKAETEARVAEEAENAAETKVRRLRVAVVLERLNDNAEDRRLTGRSLSPVRYARAIGGRGGGAAGAAGGEDILAVPGIGKRGNCSDVGGTPRGGGGGSAAAPAVTLRCPALGQRRLKQRLDRARRFASLSRGRGPQQRQSLCEDMAERGGKAGGGWLESKVARMRKAEEGEWNAWNLRVEEEEASSPGEAAGPPLPFGFVPRLAHRALGAYALIRTLSRPLRLSPASSIAFLRALCLKMRTPLLDAVHSELLRRISCLLKGRAGGWAKGKDAQRELDWRFLDQVSVLCCIRLCVDMVCEREKAAGVRWVELGLEPRWFQNWTHAMLLREHLYDEHNSRFRRGLALVRVRLRLLLYVPGALLLCTLRSV